LAKTLLFEVSGCVSLNGGGRMNEQTYNHPEESMTAASPKDESLKEKIGDILEKAGHKISDAGAHDLGQKIHDLGDSMEKDHSNPEHPHKV
jgi:hypothetical protein